VLLVSVGAGLAASAASARLTPLEQRWVKPLLAVWTQQNAALHLVLPAASAKDALLVGTAANAKLTTVLNTFVVCSPELRKAGDPPSPRLRPYLAALTTACTHATSGAHDFAKAVGAVGKGKGALAQSYLARGVAEFKRATSALTTAYRAIIAIGGKNIFTA